MRRIEDYLRDRIGLDAASVGVATIHRAIRRQMNRVGLQTVAAYAQLLERCPADWEQLVEAVVVTETWFFREPEVFAALVRLAQDHWMPAHPGRKLRLLSLPCASGEEPYSAAIALLEAGVLPDQFRIEAADVSARALARARRAVYGKNSFRGPSLGFRQRHFYLEQEGFALAPAVRQCVHFEQRNLLDEHFAEGQGRYDVIFCRNLLIYFDRPTQARALARLAASLAPEGVLFLSPAEQPLALAHGFVLASLSPGLACCKPGAVIGAPSPAAASRHRPRSAGFQPAVAQLSNPPAVGNPQAPGVFPASADWKSALRQAGSLRHEGGFGAAELECARQLVDAGQLAEAAALCERHLYHSPHSAQAYYLLGLVRQADGDERAADCYRRALYLEPNHYPTLVQLASLAEKSGDPARARLFKRRAERVDPTP